MKLRKIDQATAENFNTWIEDTGEKPLYLSVIAEPVKDLLGITETFEEQERAQIIIDFLGIFVKFAENPIILENVENEPGHKIAKFYFNKLLPTINNGLIEWQKSILKTQLMRQARTGKNGTTGGQETDKKPQQKQRFVKPTLQEFTNIIENRYFVKDKEGANQIINTVFDFAEQENWKSAKKLGLKNWIDERLLKVFEKQPF